MNRFLKSRQLDDDQRQAIAATLDGLQIGDAEGRRIFVFALDYELTEYANFLTGRVAPAAVEGAETRSALTQLETSLRPVMLHVQNLSPREQSLLFDQLKADDDYRRTYDTDYLAALQAELDRVQVACRDASKLSMRTDPATEGRPEGRFVRMLAKAYSECFEVTPAAQQSGSFALLLSAVGEQVGLDLNFDEASLEMLIHSTQ